MRSQRRERTILLNSLSIIKRLVSALSNLIILVRLSERLFIYAGIKYQESPNVKDVRHCRR